LGSELSLHGWSIPYLGSPPPPQELMAATEFEQVLTVPLLARTSRKV
jgi:hypothetical protein